MLLDSGKNISLRGLSVVSDAIIWASGTQGTVVRSTNGREQFVWMKIPGYENRDFRDIEAFDENTAILIAIDTPAVILKTKDGGNSWKKVWEDRRPGIFLDALYFEDSKYGIVVGDSIEGHFFLAVTKDGGNHWEKINRNQLAAAPAGEVLFAASGSNILLHKRKPVYVTGGNHTHLIIGKQKTPLPINSGESSVGANAITRSADGRIIIVGGDYMKDTLSKGNCILTDDEGKTFITPATPPKGYKSAVAWLGEKKWMSCGTSGVDISNDHGMNWKHISDQSFHVVQKAKKGNSIFLAGKNGVIARFTNAASMLE